MEPFENTRTGVEQGLIDSVTTIQEIFSATEYDLITDKFDLILILRCPALSMIPEDVFRNVSRSLSGNDVLLVSGGYREGDLRGLSGLTSEKYAPVKYLVQDFYRGCSGENAVFKFRKQNDEV